MIARADAEGDGGLHYAHVERVKPPMRWVYPRLLATWDGGPVRISDTELAAGVERMTRLALAAAADEKA